MKISRTVERLKRPGPPALLVSLPRNDPALAQAAAEGGAEGLKVHIYVEHAAAGCKFGSLAEERQALEEIVSLGLPVGIVPGDEQAMASPAEIEALAEIGIDYLDSYIAAMPAWMLFQPHLPVMAALGPQDRLHPKRWKALARIQPVQMIEASIIEHAGYGQPLSASDVCDYTYIVQAFANKPVIVPTQRCIQPADLPILAATGLRGVLIGAIVTGTEAYTIKQSVKRYREALSAL